MALTPEGTPYVESTDLVANYPAASLSLANRVDLVGVLPFADSAARATAIPSPTDGQYSYLQDTNLTEFWNGSAWVSASALPTIATASVNTQQTTTSTSYTDLATSGPAVTITTGTKALVIITALYYASGTENFSLIGFDISGATTVAASNEFSLTNRSTSSTPIIQASAVYLVSGLTAGSNTFTMKYRVTASTGFFENRKIIVQDQGS